MESVIVNFVVGATGEEIQAVFTEGEASDDTVVSIKVKNSSSFSEVPVSDFSIITSRSDLGDVSSAFSKGGDGITVASKDANERLSEDLVDLCGYESSLIFSGL